MLKITTLLTLFILMATSSCMEIRVLSAKNYPAKEETAQSILKYAKSKNIDGYPILRYDSLFPDGLNGFELSYGLFNKHGDYIVVNDSGVGCKAKDYNYVTLRYILQNGDLNRRTDSIQIHYINDIPEDPILQKVFFEKYHTDKLFSDSIYKNTEIKMEEINLKYYADHLINLQGDKIELDSMYKDYVVLQEFTIEGPSDLLSMRIRDITQDIRKLKKEFNNRIQLVLINKDVMFSY